MANVAIIETKKSRNNYKDYFDFDFDEFQLCSDSFIKKVLKRDVDIDIDIDDYDWVILVGADALKYYTKVTSVTEYSGKVVEDKFIPIINPGMLAFKPEMRNTWDASVSSVASFISGEKVHTDFSGAGIAFGLDDTDEINKFLQKAIDFDCPYYALDSETSAFYPRNGYVLGASLSYDGLTGTYILADSFDEVTEGLLQELAEKKTTVFHNAKFDLGFFEYHFNLRFPKFEDTMLLHYLIDENPGTHGLKQLAMRYTEFGDYDKELNDWIKDYLKKTGIRKADFSYDLIPFSVMKVYAGMDALVTFQLFEKFVKIKGNTKLAKVYDNILIPGTRFLTDMQDNGVPFDRDRLVKGQHLMEKEIEAAVAEVYTHPQIHDFEVMNGQPFNPNSVVQLRKLLFDYMGLQPTGKKTGTGANSTDAEVLGELSEQSDVPRLILNIRQKTKIKNTYLDKIIPQLDKDSRLRTGFNLHTTTSGRLSSSGKLNMQQLPRDNAIVKGCILAAPGRKIVSMDLTTAEVYIAAKLADDKALQDVFRAGGNFHSTIAKKVFKLPCDPDDVVELFPLKRQAAKAVSFGIMYGAGAKKISDTVTKDSGTYFGQAEAQDVIDEYFEEFHRLKAWLETSKKFIMQNGFIYSALGRKRRLPNVMSTDQGIQGHAVRSGLNFLVQSVASDINLLGAIDMNMNLKAARSDTKIFALVHDSILADVADENIESYSADLLEFVQTDRGVSIPGCPIGCDFEVHQDYAMGKYEKQYGDML